MNLKGEKRKEKWEEKNKDYTFKIIYKSKEDNQPSKGDFGGGEDPLSSGGGGGAAATGVEVEGMGIDGGGAATARGEGRVR